MSWSTRMELDLFSPVSVLLPKPVHKGQGSSRKKIRETFPESFQIKRSYTHASQDPSPREKTKFNSIIIIQPTYQGWGQVLSPQTIEQYIHFPWEVWIQEKQTEHVFWAQTNMSSNPSTGQTHLQVWEVRLVVILGRKGVVEIGTWVTVTQSSLTFVAVAGVYSLCENSLNCRAICIPEAFHVVPVVENPPANRRHKPCRFDPWVGKIPWSRKWQPTPVFLPGKFHGQRSLEGYQGARHDWMTEHVYPFTSLNCHHFSSPGKKKNLYPIDLS